MKIKSIREKLAQLNREIQQAENVDADARLQLQELRRRVDQIEETAGSEIDSLWDRAKALEARFASEHPTLERMARELADAVAKMGI